MRCTCTYLWRHHVQFCYINVYFFQTIMCVLDICFQLTWFLFNNFSPFLFFSKHKNCCIIEFSFYETPKIFYKFGFSSWTDDWGGKQQLVHHPHGNINLFLLFCFLNRRVKEEKRVLIISTKWMVTNKIFIHFQSKTHISLLKANEETKKNILQKYTGW